MALLVGSSMSPSSLGQDGGAEISFSPSSSSPVELLQVSSTDLLQVFDRSDGADRLNCSSCGVVGAGNRSLAGEGSSSSSSAAAAAAAAGGGSAEPSPGGSWSIEETVSLMGFRDLEMAAPPALKACSELT